MRVQSLLLGLVALVLVGCAAESPRVSEADSTGSAEQVALEGGKQWKSLATSLGKVKVGEVAPDFELKDVEGESWKLSDYKGSVVVLDFWALW